MSIICLSRRLLLAAAVAVAIPVAADAAQRLPFTDKTFGDAQASGAPILVEVSAPWCPTCKAQKPIIDGLAAKAENKDLVILQVDFDTQKAALKALNARQQSTLIAYRGKTETGRSVGDTNPQSIEALVGSTRKN